METMKAFQMGEKNRGNESMVFDWAKAARRIKEVKPKHAAAGLRGDWEWTGGSIYKDGKPVPKGETYTFLASTWAVPELMMDDQIEPCYVMKSQTKWNADTYWPKTARKILGGEE